MYVLKTSGTIGKWVILREKIIPDFVFEKINEYVEFINILLLFQDCATLF